MKRILIEKNELKEHETKDKYLSKFEITKNGYPDKSFTCSPECAITFPTLDSAKHVVQLLYLNSPFLYKPVEIEANYENS